MRIVFWLLLILVVAFGGLSLYYGSPDPCRMLAKERADRAAGAINQELGTELPDEGFDRALRLQTSQMDTWTCTRELWRVWWS
jgi:hypothetical protein